MHTNPESYDSHRRIQLRDTSVFLERVVRGQMDWSREEQDVVMDVGCGPGGCLRDILLPRFPRVKRFIGVDCREEFVQFARHNYADPRIEFHVADIEDRKSVEKWFEQVTKVLSIYCFHWLRRLDEGFRNVHQLLRPGGEAALLLCVGAATWSSTPLLYQNPKWRQYLPSESTYTPARDFETRDESYYRTLLQGMGFEVRVCEMRERTYLHQDDDDCRDCWFAVNGLSQNIPPELREDFKRDFYEALMRYSSRDPDGKPVSHYTNLTLLVRKKSC